MTACSLLTGTFYASEILELSLDYVVESKLFHSFVSMKLMQNRAHDIHIKKFFYALSIKLE